MPEYEDLEEEILDSKIDVFESKIEEFVDDVEGRANIDPFEFIDNLQHRNRGTTESGLKLDSIETVKKNRISHTTVPQLNQQSFWQKPITLRSTLKIQTSTEEETDNYQISQMQVALEDFFRDI
jgi:hypothetical protein